MWSFGSDKRGSVHDEVTATFWGMPFSVLKELQSKPSDTGKKKSVMLFSRDSLEINCAGSVHSLMYVLHGNSTNFSKSLPWEFPFILITWSVSEIRIGQRNEEEKKPKRCVGFLSVFFFFLILFVSLCKECQLCLLPFSQRKQCSRGKNFFLYK